MEDQPYYGKQQNQNDLSAAEDENSTGGVSGFDLLETLTLLLTEQQPDAVKNHSAVLQKLIKLYEKQHTVHGSAAPHEAASKDSIYSGDKISDPQLEYINPVTNSRKSVKSLKSDPTPPRLITELSSLPLLQIIKQEIERSKHIYIASAFCSSGIINLLVSSLETLADNSGSIRLITSCMNHVNDPQDLLHLQRMLPKGDLHIYDPDSDGMTLSDMHHPPAFHPKIYLFEHLDGRKAMLIGSSNLTINGMLKNIEWNYYSNMEISFPLFSSSESLFDQAKRQFMKYWEQQSFSMNQSFCDQYQAVRNIYRSPDVMKTPQTVDADRDKQEKPVPRPPQQQALANLDLFRANNFQKAAVIAATGLGKTYLSAFDVQQAQAKRILFIAHRENILLQAEKTFLAVLPGAKTALFSGQHALPSEFKHMPTSEMKAQPSILFSTIQSLAKLETLKQIPQDAFDYIIIDEFHHARAPSYNRLIAYFKPKFLLGMTATPDRMDGRDILEICDYNIAYDVRLFEAIDNQWLTPFQYYAIYDPTDYEQITWTGSGYDSDSLEEHLSTDTRAKLVTEKLSIYLPYRGKTKALAFCSNIGHARYMSEQFSHHGFPARCLLGGSSIEERSRTIRELADENQPLQVICSVDIFNEGIDIPELSHILLLRPTESPIVFLQQIGRGLRRQEGKDYVVILDFIGNFRKASLTPKLLARSEDDRETMQLIDRMTHMEQLKLPSLCSIQVDTEVKRIWKEELSRSLKRDKRAYYLSIYQDIRSSTQRPFECLDSFVNEAEFSFSTSKIIRVFGSWLRFKQAADDLSSFEKSLLDTPAETFLRHIERQLNPQKTYKMVVLSYLLSTPLEKTSWEIDDISRGFHQFYISHPLFIQDYPELSRSGKPEEFPLRKIRSHIIKNPLNYLSDTEKDCFVLNRESGTFALKQEYIQYWQMADFRRLLDDRVSYIMKSYVSRHLA